MLKYIFSFIVLITSLSSIAQKKHTNKADMDSLKQGGDMEKPTSYVRISAGVGNQLLSLSNKALNAQQVSNKVVFTPSLGYYHKSGFGISATGYLLSDSTTSGLYQTALTPSYEYDGDNLSSGISYTRYIVKNKYGGAIAPIQNDIYANLLFKKPWLRPGVAIGISNGVYKEINLVTVNLPGIGLRSFIDTATTKTNAFTLIGMLEHTFEMGGLMSADDYLSFTPAIMLNAGSSKVVTTHQNRFTPNVQDNKRKFRGGTGQPDVIPFGIQSIGANFNFAYSIGKFTFEPQLYLDYYLHDSDTNKFTQVYNIVFAFMF